MKYPAKELSFGRTCDFAQDFEPLAWETDLTEDRLRLAKTYLVRGAGRSYGDSNLNLGGTLFDYSQINRVISFDEEKGELSCEGGVLLSQLLPLTVPKGFFLPVCPGTKFVTVAGAIANDIHGKNHHQAGTFGNHVMSLSLLRSDGRFATCSPTENQKLYAATIGGLGLTGVITRATIRLKKIQSRFLDVEIIKYRNLDEFFTIAEESDRDFEYTVAWVDCLAKGDSLGRGHFIRGNHSPKEKKDTLKVPSSRTWSIPCEAPNFLLNRLVVKSFNSLYYHRLLAKKTVRRVPYDGFFFPLDAIAHWNFLYGRRGFFQYQLVLPSESLPALRDIFYVIAESGQASSLAVLKKFGSIASPGILSFPMDGFTLSLDFANRGHVTRDLFRRLDEIVMGQGGRLYPAKDAHMSQEMFRRGYSNWQEVLPHLDPQCSSGFWRRVNSTSPELYE